MIHSDRLDEERVRAVVREELVGSFRMLLGTILWMGLAVVALLVGLQSFQVALSVPSPLATAGFALLGTLVVAASAYLLYFRHWE